MGIFLTNDTDIIAHFRTALQSIRSGRVNATILDQVMVHAYGSSLSIRELATVTQPESSQLLITPFDKSVNQAIEKALFDAQLGASPVNDGAGIRLSFPNPTEEDRKNRTKIVDTKLEETKVTVRLARQAALKSLEAQEKNGEMGEDDLKRAEIELQKEVDAANSELEIIAKAKKEELMKM